MCSIGEDDFGDDGGVHAMIPEKNHSMDDTIGQCKKCGKENCVVFKLYFRDFECKDCFLANARHKFRATLGSSKVLPRAASVLLAFDGSDAAMVLLDMLYYAQNQNNFKRLHCTIKIIYIHDFAINSQHSDKQEKESLFAFRDKMLSYPAFNSYVSAISTDEHPNIFEIKDLENFLCRPKRNEIDFIQKLKALKSLTSRQDFLRYQRNRLIAKVAKLLECPFVFYPDISANLATQLLTAIVLGRGGSAAYDVALVDERLGENIKIIRPLRDLNQPEIDLYVSILDLKPLKTNVDNFGISSGPAASLQNLTHSFVENLQGNYSSTVSTVFRCCDKIAPKNNLNDKLSSLSLVTERTGLPNFEVSNQNISCSFCGSPIHFESSNTLLAIEFSRLVSERGASSNDCSELDSLARTNLAQQSIEKPLCHACRSIAKDNDSSNDFLFER